MLRTEARLSWRTLYVISLNTETEYRVRGRTYKIPRSQAMLAFPDIASARPGTCLRNLPGRLSWRRIASLVRYSYSTSYSAPAFTERP